MSFGSYSRGSYSRLSSEKKSTTLFGASYALNAPAVRTNLLRSSYQIVTTEIKTSLMRSSYQLQAPVSSTSLFQPNYQIQVPAFSITLVQPHYELKLFQTATAIFQTFYRVQVVTADEEIFAGTNYEMILTGGPNSLPDVTIPMSRFNVRKRSGSPSSATIIVPNGSFYAASIAARPDGDIIINRITRFKSGLNLVEELIDVNFNNFRSDLGPANDTITFGGRKQTTNTTPSTVPIGKAVIRRDINGRLSYRAVLDVSVQPADTIDINGEQFVVDNISYTVDQNTEVMDVNG